MNGALAALDPATLLLAQPVTAAQSLPPSLTPASADGGGFARLLREERVRALDGTVPAEQAPAERTRQERELREAAHGLEALLVNQMFTAMRKSVPKNEMFDGGMGEDIFRGMLDQEYSMMMSKTGSLGLADIIYDQMHDYIA